MAFEFTNLEERVKHEVDEIVKYGKVKESQKILDVPCSYGKHAIELARRVNCEIYGIDINNFEIDVAIYRANQSLDVYEKPVKLKTKPKFMTADMRNFSAILNDFDLIYNWFWSLGYFDHEENLKVLKEFYFALKEEGILLIHTIPKENIRDYLLDWSREILPTKIMGKQYPEGVLNFTKVFNKEKGIMHTTWIVMLKNGIVLPNPPVISTVIMYSTQEYVEMLEQIGFKDIEVYDSYFPSKILKAKK